MSRAGDAICGLFAGGDDELAAAAARPRRGRSLWCASRILCRPDRSLLRGAGEPEPVREIMIPMEIMRLSVVALLAQVDWRAGRGFSSHRCRARYAWIRPRSAGGGACDRARGFGGSRCAWRLDCLRRQLNYGDRGVGVDRRRVAVCGRFCGALLPLHGSGVNDSDGRI